MQYAVQAKEADGFSDAHRHLALSMEYFQAEFEKRVADIDVRIAEGTCKCPMSCPGPRTGICGQAQGPTTTNPRCTPDKGTDPWSQARAGGQGSGGSGGSGPKGPGGGGSGGGRGPGGQGGSSGGNGGGGGGGPPGGPDNDAEVSDLSGLSQDYLPEPTTNNSRSSASHPSKRRLRTKNYHASTARQGVKCGGKRSGCTSTARTQT